MTHWNRRTFASFASSVPLLKRDPAQLASRIACTHLLLTRWGIESAAHSNTSDSSDRLKAALQALQKTLSAPDTENLFWTDKERVLLYGKSELGSWDPLNDMYPLKDRWEAQGILLWTLGVFKQIPSYDTDFPKEIVFQAAGIVPSVPESIKTFVQHFRDGVTHQLVTEAEFQRGVAMAEAWYWRAKAQRVLELKKSLERPFDNEQEEKSRNKKIHDKLPKSLELVLKNIHQAIEAGSQRALEETLIPSLVDGDFPVNGLAYKGLTDHQLRDLDDRIEARLVALGWLTGKKDWDTVPKGEASFIHPMGSLWTPQES